MAKKKILVIDDDDAVLDAMRARLGGAFDVVATKAPNEALRLALAEGPDLILCDLDMPDIDGGDVSAALFDDDRLRHIPLLFLTALLDQDRLDAMNGQIGGRPAVSKRAPAAELLARIRSLIEG
jgi:CheY-like chemotaxis protein